MMPLVSGRNSKRTFNKSNLNQVLSAARKAVAEGRAREENLQEQLDKVLKEKADLEKAFENERLASANSHKNEKSQLESAIREEKAAVERSLKEEKAALEKALISEKEALERSLREEYETMKNKLESDNNSSSNLNLDLASKNKDLLAKCEELNKKINSLEKRCTKEMRARISSERDLSILKKRLSNNENKEEKEEAEPKKEYAFGQEVITNPSRVLSIDKIVEKETPMLVKRNEPASSTKKVRFSFKR